MQIFTLSINYFSYIYITVNRHLRDFYVIVFAAKRCLMSVNQMDNWNHLIGNCYRAKVRSHSDFVCIALVAGSAFLLP